jgi:hypothetical protein
VGWNIVEGWSRSRRRARGEHRADRVRRDSFVETISGAILIWRLSAEAGGTLDEEMVEAVEERAERLVGSRSWPSRHSSPSRRHERPGPRSPGREPVGSRSPRCRSRSCCVLARAKRQTGEALGSRALLADAQQTAALVPVVDHPCGLCPQCPVRALVGDPVAALGIALLLVREGLEAIAGHPVGE